ncbi:hypothetical protein F4804DRAFT_346684 [Jackrogersella minutella]|nr:hypothetical protein F4804DRAFT_346684 [Jackrogersella minutella]
MYGCTDETTEKVVSRISKCELSTFHPLTLPIILADIERNRHDDMVLEYSNKLVQRAFDIGQSVQNSRSSHQSSTLDPEKPDTDIFNPIEDNDTLVNWLEMNNIRNGLESWKAELQNLLQHIYELERVHNGVLEPLTDDVAHDMRRQGIRIEERLIQIINEYDEKVRQCSTVIDGMSFATQMEWNHIARADTNTNLEISSSTMEISKATQRDGSQMRSIALLTMIFLPGTFVATLFSMSFFNWNIASETILSPYIWIYAVATLILTVTTIMTWHYCTVRSHGSKKKILPL